MNPETGEVVVIEMNPRVSRSSALASKATGFPIAKIAAKLAVGYTLDEIPNDITQQDAGVLRADARLRGGQDAALGVREVPAAPTASSTTQMKTVGEAMAIGRTFKEAFQKALRSRELDGRRELPGERPELRKALAVPTCRALRADPAGVPPGSSVDEIHELTGMLAVLPRRARATSSSSSARCARRRSSTPSCCGA